MFFAAFCLCGAQILHKPQIMQTVLDAVLVNIGRDIVGGGFHAAGGVGHGDTLMDITQHLPVIFAVTERRGFLPRVSFEWRPVAVTQFGQRFLRAGGYGAAPVRQERSVNIKKDRLNHGSAFPGVYESGCKFYQYYRIARGERQSFRRFAPPA